MSNVIYQLRFKDVVEFEHEITVVEVDNDLHLTDSEIEALPNCYTSKGQAEIMKGKVIDLMKLQVKEPSAMRTVEEYLSRN